MSLWSTVQVDMLGVARIARSQGLASMAAGLGFLLGVPIGGKYILNKKCSSLLIPSGQVLSIVWSQIEQI